MVDNDGWSPLWLAAKNGHLSIVQYLHQEGADKDKVDEEGWSPLHVAAMEGHLTVVQYLCEIDASVRKLTIAQESPLWVAVQFDRLEVVQYLCEHGVSNLDEADHLGRTALYIAVLMNRTQIVSLLLYYNASMNLRSASGQLPTDIANSVEMKQIINDEEKRRRDHGFKRSVIPVPVKEADEITDRNDDEEGDESEVSSDEEE